MMFAVDIGMASYQGIKLHRTDGSEYWKLRLTCANGPCAVEIEMGECLCFGSEDAMVKARDHHGMYCSAKCWIPNHTKEEVAEVMNQARNTIKELEKDDLGLLIDDLRDVNQVLDGYWEYVAEHGYYDGSEFFENYDVEDCPI